MKHDQIYIVENHEEAEQFRYVDTDQPVEPGTPVGCEVYRKDQHDNLLSVDLLCFEDIYFCDGIV